MHAQRQVEVSVVNPRRARRFAESLGERSKTDPVDAGVLCEYAMRMRWVPWVPPNLVALRLRALTRAIEDLGVMQDPGEKSSGCVDDQPRSSCLSDSGTTEASVLSAAPDHAAAAEALRLIARDPELDRRFRLMLTTPGIGETSALEILGELAVLPDTLDARQWVAFSGLDPCRFTSGTSVEKKPRISRGGSRHLRRALYMPALVAMRHEPYLRAFYRRLLARGKASLQAVVAVMRKLLHAFFAMFHSDHPYHGSKLCPLKFAPDTVALCA